MKSDHKPIPRREALNKYVRAKAHREGTLFKDALESVSMNENGAGGFIPVLKKNGCRDCERSDTRQRLRGERHVKSPARDSAGRSVAVDREEDTTSEIAPPPRRTDMTVHIMNIAKPAKRKGVGKDFELVSKVRNVVALEEKPQLRLPGDDEWEKIYDEEELDARPSYSSILRGNER